MAKRANRRSKRSFVTMFPNHHEVVDKASRRLAGSSHRKLLAIANKLLNEPLIEDQPEVHTVLDDRVPVEQIGTFGLRPTWHGRA